MRVAIATEDELSEACAEKLLAQITDHQVGQRLRRDGFGYLRKNVNSFAQVAQNVMPVLLITDLDRKACPATLIKEWLPKGRGPNMLFRVAVRSIESWLLADSSGFAAFVGIAENSISRNPDDLPQPKAELLRLARRPRNRAL